MTRKEERIEAAKQRYGEDTKYLIAKSQAFLVGAKWADKTMIDKACKCFCDSLCDISGCGMCFYKYDEKHQIKSSFQYNECNNLKVMRRIMEEEV